MPIQRRLKWTFALALVLLPGLSWALGLGGIRSYSALNEPFLGLIELNGAAPEELDAVKVILASEAEFTKAGSPRPDFLTGLVFVPEVSTEGKVQVRVTSPKPIREPYLDFLVEVTSPKGRLVKGYTVLLDPPTTRHRPPPQVMTPKAVSPVSAPISTLVTPSVAPPVRPPVTGGEHAASPSPQAPVNALGPTLSPPAGYPLRYGPVPSGANLSNVARRMAPEGASQAQTALAIYRANPQAFSGGNINKLKAGARLEIPHPYLIFAYDAETAKQQFLAAQRQQPLPPLPAALQDGAQGPGLEPIQNRLEIATREPGPVGEGIAKIPVLPSQPPPGSRLQSEPDPARSPTLAPELALVEREILLVREMAESGRQETADLRGRIGRLEDHLADIKRLLELSNAQLAQLQGAGAQVKSARPIQELEPAIGDGIPATSLEPGDLAAARVQEPSIAAVTDASGEAAPDQEGQASTPSAPVATQALAPSSEDAAPEKAVSAVLAVTQPASKLLGASDSAPATAEPKPASQSQPETQPKLLPEPAAKQSPPQRLVVEAPSPEPSFFDDLSSWALVVGGPLLILLLGLLFLVRRQNQAKEAISAAEQVTLAAGPPAQAPAPLPKGGEPNRLLALITRARGWAAQTARKIKTPEALPLAFETAPDLEMARSQPFAPSAPDQTLAKDAAPSPRPARAGVTLPVDEAVTPPEQPLDSHPAAQELLAVPASADRVPLPRKEAEEKAGDVSDSALRGTPAPPLMWTESPDLEVPPELTLAVTAQSAPSAMPSEEPYQLDLSDLKGWDLGVPSALKPPEPVPITPTGSLEALDLMTPFLGNLALTPPAPSPAPEPAPDLTAGDFDLDLEGLAMLGVASNSVEGDHPHEPMVDLDLDLDDLMDLDLTAFASADNKAEQPQAAPSSNPPLDWGALALTLEQEEPQPEEAQPGAYPTDADCPGDFQMDPGPWDEVGIKLDLARAYLQMDDPEAARVILAEVIAEGTGEQIAEAKAMQARWG